MINSKNYSNGLRLMHKQLPNVKSFTLMVYTIFGSRDEEKGEEGLAHLLEHMFFKSTKTSPALTLSGSMQMFFASSCDMSNSFIMASAYKFTFLYIYSDQLSFEKLQVRMKKNSTTIFSPRFDATSRLRQARLQLPLNCQKDSRRATLEQC